MSKLRMAAVAVLTSCAVVLGAAGTASAAQAPAKTPLTKTVKLTGSKGFKGTYTIDRFASRNGKLVAIGTLKGKLRKNGKTKKIRRSGVRMPASVAGAGPAAQGSQLPNIPNACQVLNLVLGPINLNLLGPRRPDEPDQRPHRRRPGRRQPASATCCARSPAS